MSPDERGKEQGEPQPPDELGELRARIAQLEAGAPSVHRHVLRNTGSVVLIVIASVLSMLAAVAVWADDQVTDTDRYVAAVAPLAGNAQVQDAVSNRITGVVLQQIDVKALVGRLSRAAAQRGAPPQLSSLVNELSGPITGGLTSLIRDVVHRVVASEAFATVWTEANRAGHKALNKALTGQGGGAVQLKGNQVTVDVGPAIDKVKNQLVSSGLGIAAKIPTVHTQFVVFSSPDIAKYKTWFRLLQLAGDWLPLVAVVVAAIGVFLSTDRRKALIGAALGVAAAMLVLGVAVAVFRSFYLDHLPPDASPGAAGAVYDALARFLRQAVRAVGVLALVVAIGAFFVGPSRVALTTREASSIGIGGVRRVAESAGFRAGPVEPFVRRFKHWIGAAILLVAAVVFLFWAHPTAMVVFWFAVVVLAAFAIREFLAPAPARPAGRQPGTSG